MSDILYQIHLARILGMDVLAYQPAKLDSGAEAITVLGCCQSLGQQVDRNPDFSVKPVTVWLLKT
jgi:hypothetical protein